MTKYMTLGVLAFGFAACDSGGDDSTGGDEADADADTDADTDTDTDSDPSSVTVNWTTANAEIVVDGGSGNYTLGITESGGCGGDCWEAEDGIGGQTANFGPFVHTVGGDDTSTLNCVSDPKDVTDNSTLFCGVVDQGKKGQITFYLASSDDSWCAVWGSDPGYYSGHGCETWK